MCCGKLRLQNDVLETPLLSQENTDGVTTSSAASAVL